MKRRDLVKKIESAGGKLIRNGGNHDIYELNNKEISVPRHKEINEILAKKIIKDLGLK